VLLGELIRGGIEPTPQLIEGLLYEGRIHSIASGTGTGKTLIALWATLQVMRQGLPVLYLDAENGPKVIAERLEEMGADLDELDRLIHYHAADLTLEPDSVAALLATVDDVEPALVVFDSLADFLGMASLEENANSDVTAWFMKVAQPLKDAGVTSLILDHVPKTGKGGPRGASSKVAKMDVQWELEVTQRFNRDRTGEIELKHTKDRECWLPKIVRFSVGGGVFARSYGTIEEPDEDTKMSDNASLIYDVIVKAGKEGARWTDCRTAVGGSRGATQRGLDELTRHNLVLKRDSRYYVVGPVEEVPNEVPPEGEDSGEVGPLSEEDNAPDGPRPSGPSSDEEIALPIRDRSGTGVGPTRSQSGPTVPGGTRFSEEVPQGPSPLKGRGPWGPPSRDHLTGPPERDRQEAHDGEADRSFIGPSNNGKSRAGADRTQGVRLTAEEAARVQQRIREGMSPKLAREEVLRKRKGDP
jgi:hypothetical protein